ncbi:MAG: glycosyltransferase family 2 protein [Saprospiraceae bacterium]|nr:glycosyltransferase family 2 protein [Saprospiraceae bacterium]MBK8851289.1 glycosyltransferase family 2 protein [Saprospiraceae bacterium]MBL0085066.1 glycosyltransferase family 2 protein [Saprospiraceae bacterium]
MEAKISVIIPAFNAATYVEQAINSALIQEEVLEVIVIDDASTDATAEVVQKLMARNSSKLVYKVNAQNLGPGASRNIGIRTARGQYLSFLDADDYFLPGRFSHAVQLLAERPDVDGCFTRVQNVWQDDFRPAAFQHQDIIGYTGSELSQKDLLYHILAERGDFFSIIALLVKKSAVEQTALLDESFLYGGDIEFIYELCYKCLLVPEKDEDIKIIRRLHDQNITSSEGHRQFNDRWKLIQKWLDHISDYQLEPRTCRALVLRYVHFWYVIKGYPKSMVGRQIIKSGLLLQLLTQKPFLLKRCTLG